MLRIISIMCFISHLAFGHDEVEFRCSPIAIQMFKGDLDTIFPMSEVQYTFDTVKVDLGDSTSYIGYNPKYNESAFYWLIDEKPNSTDLDLDFLDEGILEGTITFKRKHYWIQYEFSNNYVVKETQFNRKGKKIKSYFSVPIDSLGKPCERPQRVDYKRIRRTKMVAEAVFCDDKIRSRLTPMKIEENE